MVILGLWWGLCIIITHIISSGKPKILWMVSKSWTILDGWTSIPSGKLTVCYGKLPFIVYLPINTGDFPHFFSVFTRGQQEWDVHSSVFNARAARDQSAPQMPWTAGLAAICRHDSPYGGTPSWLVDVMENPSTNRGWDWCSNVSSHPTLKGIWS